MNEPTLEQQHLAFGGKIGAFAGAPAVLEYQDGWEAEYRATRAAVGIVERTDLAVIRMWGKDPVRMLNGLITNEILNLGMDRAVYGAMLTPKGRMITDLRAALLEVPEGSAPEIRIDVPRIALDSVSAHLKKYLPPHFARWSVLEDQTILGVYGRSSAEIVALLLGREPASEEDAVTRGVYRELPVTALATRMAGEELGFDVFIPNEVLAAAWAEAIDQTLALSGRPLGMRAFEVLRVEAGRPRFGVDMTEDTIPAEALASTGQMERAISFSKGCYTGQEVVVRIAHRGHVNRHLRGIVLTAGAVVESGAAVMRPEDGKEVGRVTSAVASPLARAPIAMAHLRREVEPGELVTVDGREARVVELPFVEGVRFELPE